ncbi:MAG TPA: aspartyl protease family protein [Steroidobacteraceae bacterium]|nr:aspartyl protease family protein [Steroidobacteraceae bacterium]
MVPIDQTVLHDGAIRYSIDMRIDGRPLRVMLDSGSTGLRLMPRAVARLGLKTGDLRKYAFSSGVALWGSTVRVQAAIGASAAAAVPAQAVDLVTCEPRRPDCPASWQMSAGFRIGADDPDEVVSRGFLAILGVGLQPADLPNPLAIIGGGRWVIDLPLPGDRHPGRLVLDPAEQELGSYETFPLEPTAGRVAGWQDTIPGCLLRKENRDAICGRMLLDTGSTGFQVLSPRLYGPARWPAGSRVELVFRPKGGSGVGFEFRSGRLSAATVSMDSVNPGRNADPPPIDCGVMPYYYFSVAYDDVTGAIGLKAR